MPKMLFLKKEIGVKKFTGLFILLNLELSMSLHFCQEKFSRLCADIGTKSFQSFRTFLILQDFELEKLPNVQCSCDQIRFPLFFISIGDNLTNVFYGGITVYRTSFLDRNW